jgi:pimeloyl-ACP methyl ester carboxylesterase
MCYQYYLKDLEKNFALAYWDQRIAGSSSGKVDPATLTYEQFGEDAYYVVKLLKQQFPEADLYLLGHSFGVELGWQFLTTANNEQMVKGFIAVNGTFSTYRWLYYMREWVLREADKQNKEEAKQFALNNPLTEETLKTLEWTKLYGYMRNLGGNPVSVYDDKKFVLDYLFASPNTPLAQFTHAGAYHSYDKNEIRGYDKSNQLKKITIPVALFWGKKDGVVPIEVGYETEDLLESSVRKSFVTFDESWHEPFISQKDKFVEQVTKFVGQ